MSVLPCKKAPSSPIRPLRRSMHLHLLILDRTDILAYAHTWNHARPPVLAQDAGWLTPRTHLTSPHTHLFLPGPSRQPAPPPPARPHQMPNQTRCCHVRSPSSLDIHGSPPTQQVLTRPDQRGCNPGHRCRTCREWRTGSDRSPCQASPRWPETCVLACATGQSTWAVRSASKKFMPHAINAYICFKGRHIPLLSTGRGRWRLRANEPCLYPKSRGSLLWSASRKDHAAQVAPPGPARQGKGRTGGYQSHHRRAGKTRRRAPRPPRH
jgi:hypothetical protein